MPYWEEQEKALLQCLPKLTELGVPQELLDATLGFMGMLKNPAMREITTAIEDRLVEIGYPAITHDTVLRLMCETAKFEMAERRVEIKSIEEATLILNVWICRKLGVEDGRLKEISAHTCRVIREIYNG